MNNKETKQVLLSRMAELRDAIIQTTKDTIMEWAELSEIFKDNMLERAQDWGSPQNWKTFYQAAAEYEASNRVADLINEDGYTPGKALSFTKDYYTAWSPSNWQGQNKRRWALAHLQDLHNCILHRVQGALAEYNLCRAFIAGLGD